MDPAQAVLDSISHLVVLNVDATTAAAALAVAWTTLWVWNWTCAAMARRIYRSAIFN